MEEHSIDTDKFTSVWIPSYGSDSGFYEATPKTDLDYDIHQYTSKGKIAGFWPRFRYQRYLFLKKQRRNL